MSDLKHEEQVRELIHRSDKRGEPYGWTAHKVSVGKKRLCFTNGYETIFRLEKKNFMGDGLELHVTIPVKEEKRCDLGHVHINKDQKKEYHGMTLNWEHVEQLIEWMKEGSWSEMKPKPSRNHSLLKEARALLAEIGSVSTAFSGSCKKVISKINDHLGDEE